eukprot:7613827-Pyramimonas_sp.AAC.1
MASCTDVFVDGPPLMFAAQETKWSQAFCLFCSAATLATMAPGEPDPNKRADKIALLTQCLREAEVRVGGRRASRRDAVVSLLLLGLLLMTSCLRVISNSCASNGKGAHNTPEALYPRASNGKGAHNTPEALYPRALCNICPAPRAQGESSGRKWGAGHR